ncbi:hypothetical protein [Methanomethylovorans sp.]|uniref:hypothetical protein n=1 Tax=Methanomethylovorans sp. TaxID=2758717 RepID=UPI00351C69FF
MQKQRLIPVVLLVALIFFASGLMYHLPEGGNVSPINDVDSNSSSIALLSANVQNSQNGKVAVTTLITEPVLTDSAVDLSERTSNSYYGEGSDLIRSATKKVYVFSMSTFTKTELEDESAGETTETGVI